MPVFFADFGHVRDWPGIWSPNTVRVAGRGGTDGENGGPAGGQDHGGSGGVRCAGAHGAAGGSGGAWPGGLAAGRGRPGSRPAFWQYTSTGTVNGIHTPGNTDLDQLNPGRIPLLDPGSQRGVTGSSVHLQAKPADPVTGVTLSFSATGLPPGTSISASGLITGKPSTPGTYRPTVRATDGHGHFGAVSFGWTVRDSKDPDGPKLIFTPEEWAAFTSSVRTGALGRT